MSSRNFNLFLTKSFLKVGKRHYSNLKFEISLRLLLSLSPLLYFFPICRARERSLKFIRDSPSHRLDANPGAGGGIRSILLCNLVVLCPGLFVNKWRCVERQLQTSTWFSWLRGTVLLFFPFKARISCSGFQYD